MKTIDIADLGAHFNTYLDDLRNGEELIVHDSKGRVARLLPVDSKPFWEQDAKLVASGQMTLPTKKIDWTTFFDDQAGNVPHDVAVQAVIDSRGDR